MVYRSNLQSINADTSGTYWVEVILMVKAKDTIILSITSLPLINLGTDTAICNGDSIFGCENLGIRLLMVNNRNYKNNNSEV